MAESHTHGGIAAYRSSVLGSNPVGYWGLDETMGTQANDLSTSGLQGSYVGPVTMAAEGAFGLGSIGKGFSGNGYVDIVDSGLSPLDVTRLTMEAWVKWSGQGGVNQIMNKEYAWEMAIVNGIASSAIETTDPMGWFWYGAYNPLPNQWFYFVTTYDGAYERTYVNGVLRSSVLLTGDIIVNNSSLQLGRRGFGSEYFNGSLDEVAAYGRALSQAEIRAHYNAAVNPDPVIPEPATFVIWSSIGGVGIAAAWRRRRLGTA